MSLIFATKPVGNLTFDSSRGLKLKRSIMSATALSLCLGAVGSYAQQEKGVIGLEEIVVTATRREEGLQSIPISIQAVTAKDLDDRGIYNFSDITRTIPGLEIVQSGSLVSAGVTMRGVGTVGAVAHDPSVGVLVDGVYQLRPGAAFSELLDIERVEVLRGPQGTLFGKNTTAGVIHIITANPDTEEFSGRVQGIVGSLDRAELRGLVNIPIIEGVLAARISGYTAERDGYTENVFIGEETRNVDREGWRAKVLWNATDWFQAQFSAEQRKSYSDQDTGLVAYGSNYTNFLNVLPPISIGKAQQQHAFVSDDIERYTLNLNFELPGHTLKTIHAKDDVVGFLVQDQDNTALTTELGPSGLTTVQNNNATEVLTHEVQLASNFDSDLSYVVGAYYQHEELNSVTVLGFNFGDLPRPPSTRDVESIAYFGNATYEFTDQWSASLGVRYTEDEKEGQNNEFSGIKTFDEWTWSSKLMYQLDPDKMLYFAYDKGFKSGGINSRFSTCNPATGVGCIPPEFATWAPETTFNYEVGLKSEWLDNRLRFNAALFFQTYEDFQTRLQFVEQAQTITFNATEVESKGLEMEFIAIASDNLTLSGALAYIQSEYKDFASAPCATPTSPGCVNGAQDLSGRTLDHAPELTFNVSAEYRDTLGGSNDAEWFVRLDTSYKDSQNLMDLQPPETEVDGYTLVNARVGLESAGSWKLTLWADNLTDEEYITDSIYSGNGLTRIPGLERTYGATIDWFF